MTTTTLVPELLRDTHVQQLMRTAKLLIADDKGLLAMDESTQTCNKRFAKWGFPRTR